MGEARQLGRLVALCALALRALRRGAVQPVRRDVGRIGFEHRRLIGHVGCQAADLLRAFVGERAAEAQLQPHRHAGLRLLRTAVERVRDAARHIDAAQPRDQAIGRAPHVQQHRQPGIARQLELREVERLLALAIEPGHEPVEADLAHRDE